MQKTFEDFVAQAPGSNGSRATSAEAQITTFVTMLQALDGGPKGYRLRRIILTNFWLYGRQEFEIPHGRVFLAGENASGKSTVLTAALPLGLDGDLRPNRLDTFGGRERRIEYYVLGGTESATPFSHERRTAYIALEFEWCDDEHPPIAPEIRQRWENGDRISTRFLTIGVSIAGNANTTERIRPLRFLITDGSRLGHELDTVYETGNHHEQRAYDHLRFKQVMEGHGIICDSQADYERQVARYVFGYEDIKDFEKLINLLLVLRRPNLSTELNFSRVHDYLKMSLRKIPGETTSRVIGTIERIDAIQNEIEHIQEAYNSADRIHGSRQQLALARTRLAACEYIVAQLAEDAILQRVNRLRRDLRNASNDLTQAADLIEERKTEQSQVSGQINALEASEGLQVATQLTAVRERLQEIEIQLKLQEQNRAAAQQSIREISTHLAQQQTHFEQLNMDNQRQLQTLTTIARDEAWWELAVFQLDEAQQQLAACTAESQHAPEIPRALHTLSGEITEERIHWLQRLEDLQKQGEKLDAQVQNARNLEGTRFQELDEARRHFQDAWDRCETACQTLHNLLIPFITDERLSEMLAEIDSSTEEARDEEETSTQIAVAQISTALTAYRTLIETLENDLAEALDTAQGELSELQMLVGGKQQEIAAFQERYQQKLAEPEYTPTSSERRQQARASLSQHGITAIPLYALLDFVPGTSEVDAGHVEQALEDAGLLDALVISPTQISQADSLLSAEGLSDSRLDLLTIQHKYAENNHPAGNQRQLLRLDPALSGRADITHWEMLTDHLLKVLQYATGSTTEGNFHLDDSGQWTHGLLKGQAGPGLAKYIGQATRIRARQREIAALDIHKARLEADLNEIITRLIAYEQQIEQIQTQQSQLRKLFSQSGLETSYPELTQTRLTLENSREKYQKAHQQTQELRQRYNALLVKLEQSSEGNHALISDPRRIQIALLAMIRLKNQAQTVLNQLNAIGHIWREYHSERAALERAEANASNVSSLYERVRTQALQIQAEQSELQQIAAAADAEELSERLHRLRERLNILSSELETARLNHTRIDERLNNLSTTLSEFEEQLELAQQSRQEKQSYLSASLNAYPVEQLLHILQAITDENKNSMQAAQQLLGEIQRESEAAARKDPLENEYREAYSALSRTFNHEQSILLEYGPDMDDQGQVHFLNENRSRPIDLLEILSERIELQRTLLGAEERQLFEDFLLQEIAETIRSQILEAEEWVQEINQVLSNLPMIGEHYSLQWKPPHDYDMTRLGSHLAQQYRLLRKSAQTLTREESETLMSAFRREIEAVRLRQQEHPDTNFMEALEQVFDYREWFHFDVWVTPIGGQRQRLTDRVAGTRSGAEQLFALYVPLFAALGALYRNAAPGAPRLLSLDEAFDKVSAANTRRIMEFLVSQDFQWIMTGPQVSGTGSRIAASARYLMIHEKGSPVATASASFWSDRQADQQALSTGEEQH
ncbi:TIGR02680 family protein [Dictyobacter arantiisoli]|uniref:TIGR02680 family protein n=1 Tax=Dictyobacter arantiisoli TaxID=2014874 RepID=A0A5A5TEA1_9CHLR|nr:TIGR02680 family protein [Dictyobacter arantiisoli]GCF09565.1 TIGR02680 family protein [Dictyobacter arantiisoli]